jgi:hypothetical protein
MKQSRSGNIRKLSNHSSMRRGWHYLGLNLLPNNVHFTQAEANFSDSSFSCYSLLSYSLCSNNCSLLFVYSCNGNHSSLVYPVMISFVIWLAKGRVHMSIIVSVRTLGFSAMILLRVLVALFNDTNTLLIIGRICDP